MAAKHAQNANLYSEVNTMPNQKWIDHAYPLKLLTVQVQGTRHSDLKDMADQLRKVADMIDQGATNSREDDDDFGFCFTVETNKTISIFPDPESPNNGK
jgi:hypothetical protein